MVNWFEYKSNEAELGLDEFEAMTG